MSIGSRRNASEALKLARFFMVLSSLSPLFVLWAIRGTDVIPDRWFIPGCLLLILLPNGLLWLRITRAQRSKDIRQLSAGETEDYRSHVLVYLFAILLPFYRQELAESRDLAAMVVALAFIIFLFWHLNLHYMNLFFLILKYRVFTVSSPKDGNPYTGMESFVVITRRPSLSPGDSIVAYRLSDTVYLEKMDAS